MKIIRNKLAAPAARGPQVPRRSLLEKVEDIGRSRLTVVLAPAGYGKTALLSQWRRRLLESDGACGWFTADGSECDAAAMVAYLTAALIDAGLRPSHDDAAPCGTADAAEALIVDLLHRLERAGEGRWFLFVDDAHLLAAKATAALDRLIERAPANLCCVVASRSAPMLHLARWRARGELLELGPADIRFSSAEMREFLKRAGVVLDDGDDVSAFHERTEGWIAGIKLATLSGGPATPRLDRLASFTGSNRSVADYFAEEVLAGLRPEIRDFLLHTSALDRFCPALCEAVTGRADARQLLHELDERGLFVVPLDQERGWYRYHPLFADFLQRMLSEADPRARENLQLRASYWFWDDGSPIDAIEYAKRAGTTLHEAALLERLCEDANTIGKGGLVSKYADELPQNVLSRHPNLLLTLAWRLSRSRRFKEAAEFIASADQRLAELEQSGELAGKDLRRLRYLLQHREMVLAGARDDMVTVEARCHFLLEEYPDELHPYLRGTIYGHLLVAQREQFRFADFELLAATASGVLKNSIYSLAAVGLQACIGPTLFATGQTARARQVLEQGRDESLRHTAPNSSATSACALALSEIVYENDEIDLAERLVITGLPSASGSGYIDQLQAGFVTLARVRAARGDMAGALSTLDEGMAIAIERDLARLRFALTAEKVRLSIRGGQLEKALALANAQGVSLERAGVSPGAASTAGDEHRAVIWVRLALASDRFFPAIALVRRWRTFCITRGAVRSLIRWNILLAELHFLSAAHRAAQRSLREALELGGSSRLLRSFLDEGPLIQTMLLAANGGGPSPQQPADVFAAELLARFSTTQATVVEHPAHPVAAMEAIEGHLNAREQEILELVGSGLSNREIAQRVGMTEGTIKWYLQQVYNKIGIRRRQHAVQRARQIGLISG